MRIPIIRCDASLPATLRAHPTDAGADLYVRSAVSLAPGETCRVALNLALALPEGYFAVLTGRSSTAARGLHVHLGTVDQGYRGPLYVAVTNLSGDRIDISPGDRIAQLIVLPCLVPDFVEVAELDSTERAEKGWGSSGR